MKRLHYYVPLFAGVAMLGSCSNDDVVSQATEPNVIGFKAMANKTTRAEVTTSNIDRFRVYGCVTDVDNPTTGHITVFDDVMVTRQSGATEWTYPESDKQYWSSNKDYFFVALSTNSPTPVWTFSAPDSHDTTLDKTDFKGYGTVTMDINGKDAENNLANGDRDLVYAFASRTTPATITDGSAVPFTFNHMLSRIGVKFENAFSNNTYSIKITNIIIGGLNQTGSVTLGANPSDLIWNVSGSEQTTITTVLPTGQETIGQNSNREAMRRFIIPGTQTVTIQFDVEVLQNGTQYAKKTMNGTIASQEYKPGVSYMFNASISHENIVDGGAKPIEFTVTSVMGWGDDNTGTIVFPTN